MWECTRVFVFCSFQRIGCDCGAEWILAVAANISDSGAAACREVVRVPVREPVDQTGCKGSAWTCWMTGAILSLNDYLGNKNILSHVPTIAVDVKSIPWAGRFRGPFGGSTLGLCHSGPAFHLTADCGAEIICHLTSESRTSPL